MHYWENGYYIIDPDQDGSKLDVKCNFDYEADDFRKKDIETELYYNHYQSEYQTFMGGSWVCSDEETGDRMPCYRNLFEEYEMHTKYHLSEEQTRKGSFALLPFTTVFMIMNKVDCEIHALLRAGDKYYVCVWKKYFRRCSVD